MYWWYYYYGPPVMPYDPFTMMSTMMYWMMYPYYYAILFETYRTMLDAWKKALEALTKPMIEVPKQ